jgi:hypothetical protein
VGNTFWEEEKDNKGIKLMASMGWQHGQGLGKHEQGAATHLRVKVKNNNEGIGATAATADDMFRDSQNMFNSILQRLNKSTAHSFVSGNSFTSIHSNSCNVGCCFRCQWRC